MVQSLCRIKAKMRSRVGRRVYRKWGALQPAIFTGVLQHWRVYKRQQHAFLKLCISMLSLTKVRLHILISE